MDKLKEYIKNNTLDNTKEIESSIESMVCPQGSPISLSQKSLLESLEIDGEFLVLRLHYSDFEDELKSKKIKYKISQSLSVVVSYEDDGASFEDIKKFVEYIYDISDDKQNATFGVRDVEILSEFPITILFSGILPINQLEMRVGKKIDQLIHSDDEYFVPKFDKFRDDISKEVGVPILPIFPILDEKLRDKQVHLVDITNAKLIVDFDVDEVLEKGIVDTYLLKLFYIYKVLAEGKNSSH